MKRKAALIAGTAVILLTLCACSSQAAVNVSCDDFMKQKHVSKQVEVAVGDAFTVKLCSNPTTGFKWSELAQINEQAVLQQKDHEFVPPEKTGVAGAVGQEVWTFKALTKGTSTVVMEYSRPWEGGEKGEWTFHLTVVVR